MAFTLIELLVVVAILSLLVSMLVPSLIKAKELARKMLCANNMRQVAIGTIGYTTDNNGTLPPGDNYFHGGDHTLQQFVTAYIFREPQGNRWVGNTPDHNLHASKLYCPSYKNDIRTKNPREVRYSYGYIDRGGGAFFYAYGGDSLKYNPNSLPIWDWWTANGYWRKIYKYRPSSTGILIDSTVFRQPGTGSWSTDGAYHTAFRHLGWCNYVLLDSHVESSLSRIPSGGGWPVLNITTDKWDELCGVK